VNDISFEKHSVFRIIIDYIFWYPLSSLLRGRTGIAIFTKTSKHTNMIRKYARTFKSLELMYNYHGLTFNNGIFEGLFAAFWETFVINAKALRNRLKLMKATLEDIISTSPPHCEINILSLASGSARGIIEVLNNHKSTSKINAVLIDRSINALNFSRNLSLSFGVEKQFSLIRGDVLNLNEYCLDNSQDIIEIVGFIDYLDEQTTIKFLMSVLPVLKRGGHLIISNVKNNPEKRFLSEIVNWPMEYKDEKTLRNILIKSGFNSKNINVAYEPFRIHGIAVAKK
jgi:ubiquinone/menaquinone biosynthesis C-methylase UbiE